MTKKVHFLIDDVLWVLRDITREKPQSLFDNPFIGALKTAYEKYGVKTQLNLFYRTSAFYGNDDFTLADVTDCYKKEWQEASPWLKMAFHAKEEFPDYPHVNASYKDAYDLFKAVEKEVFRFAGEDSFTYGFCPHWNAVSKEGVKAMYDCGVRIMDVSMGNATEYDGNPDSLPYGHAMRILQNRQPETRVYSRGGPNTAINNSVCGYNHFEMDDFEATKGTMKYIRDEETGMCFKKFHLPAMTLNLMKYEEMEDIISEFVGNEYVGICTHEQYFYKDYLAYQSDYAEKIYKMGEIMSKNGYEFIFAQDIIK